MEKDMEYKSLLETTQNTRDLGGLKPVMEEKQRVFRFLGVTGRDMQAIEIKNFLSTMILQQ